MTDDSDNVKQVSGFCSWCLQYGTHMRVKRHLISRNHYQCQHCGHDTVRCRLCENLAKRQGDENDGLCAEHDGTIERFRDPTQRINTLEDIPLLFAGRSLKQRVTSVVQADTRSWRKLQTRIGEQLEAGTAPDSSVMRPLVDQVAERLGGLRLYTLREGEEPAIILANGFLSQSEKDYDDWLDGVAQRFPHNKIYGVGWASQRKSYLLTDLLRSVSPGNLRRPQLGRTLAASGERWERALLSANWSGLLLANAIARCDSDARYILMGHSLGARLMFHALTWLAADDRPRIQDVYLLGGAVGAADPLWPRAVAGLEGTLYNLLSQHDKVLSKLYKACSSDGAAIGVQKIEHPRVVNFDASRLVKKHTGYKPHLARLLTTMG